MDQKAMEKLMIEMMTPGPPHEHLANMAGKWTASMVSYLEGPEPVKSEGTYEAEVILGGRYVMGHYHSTAMGQPFEGLSIDGYDNGKQKFFSIWFDSFGTGFYEAWGDDTEDGKTYRHSGTMNFGPMEIPSRSKTVIIDKDTMEFARWHTMEGQEIKAMEVTYSRVK